MRRAAVPPPFLPALAIAPLFLGGCSGVLGLDAPQLDPCLTGGACVDASSPIDSSFDDRAEASVGDGDGTDVKDVETDHAVTGVRCGGGSYPVVGCTGSTKTCCQVIDDAGDPLYVCAAGASSCDGYPIGCASNADCGGNDVCCHYSSSTKCVSDTSGCANGSLVCEPDGPADQCPSGWHCTGTVDDDGTPAPYFVCAQ